MPNWDLRCPECGDEGSYLDFPRLKRYPQHEHGTCRPCGAAVEIIPGYYGHEEGQDCDAIFPCDECGNPDDDEDDDTWEPDRHYQAGYNYAAGYHD